jgi:hypothetical protein
MSVSPVDLKMPPQNAPGQGVEGALHSGLYVAQSETVTIGTDTLPALLFNVPENTLVSEIILHTQTAVAGNTGSDNVLVGINSDSDLFMAADTVVSQAGFWSSKRGTAIGSGGYVTSSDEQVEATWTTQSSVGAFDAYLIYKPFADENYIY